jgi:hypothetical protein
VFLLLDKFIAIEPMDRDLLFCMWGHSYEFDFRSKEDSWENIEKVFSLVAEQKDIICCTNAEAMSHEPCMKTIK